MTLTVKQVAEHFGVGEHTVLGWLHSGEMRGINVGRSPDKKKPRWRVSQSALDEFERGRASTPLLIQARHRRRRDPGVIEFYK